MGGWHLRMTWGQEVCYTSLHSEPGSALSLPTVWSTWGNPGVARCWEMATLPAIPQHKVPGVSCMGGSMWHYVHTNFQGCPMWLFRYFWNTILINRGCFHYCYSFTTPKCHWDLILSFRSPKSAIILMGFLAWKTLKVVPWLSGIFYYLFVF